MRPPAFETDPDQILTAEIGAHWSHAQAIAMNILLLTDGSNHSVEAARWLASHAADLRMPPAVHVLHVHPPMPYPGAAQALGRAALEKYQRETSEESLAPACGVLRDAGVGIQAHWVVGEIAASVSEVARSMQADLVVMGTHGHGALMNLALGSVATKCIATLGVPVVVVPRPRD